MGERDTAVLDAARVYAKAERAVRRLRRKGHPLGANDPDWRLATADSYRATERLHKAIMRMPSTTE